MANLGYVQITRRCNQQCVFCSNPPNGMILSLDQAKAYVDDLVGRDYDGVILTGGEPTLFEPIAELVAYAKERGLPSRIITNGQKTARYEYLKSLADAGLTHLHLSIHSFKPEVHDYLTRTPGSLKKQFMSLENANKLGVITDINCVINKHNAVHLHENVEYLLKHFPFLHHFVWNNLDPSMNPDVDLNDVLPRLRDFEVSLLKAMAFLERKGRSFRAERVPLCFMAEYAHCSTETRKIVKHEERVIHFLDQKQTFREFKFEHGKAEVCKICRLNSVCAGLFRMGEFYNASELSPVFLDPDEVRRKVLGTKKNTEQNTSTKEPVTDETDYARRQCGTPNEKGPACPKD